MIGGTPKQARWQWPELTFPRPGSSRGGQGDSRTEPPLSRFAATLTTDSDGFASLYPDEYLHTARLQAWEEGYGRLLEQTRRSGHAQLPHGFQTADGFPLGAWIATRRIRRHALGRQWQAQLEALPGWTWDPGADRWEEGFGHLLEHVQAGGSAQPLRQDCSPDGFLLGQWVARQRASRWFLSATQRQRLDRLADWSWDPATERWNQGFRYLQHYLQQTGHAAPAQRYQATDGFPLGAWVSAQRIRRHQLRREWQQWLESLPGWSWGPGIGSGSTELRSD